MLNFNSIIIGTQNPKRLAEFYRDVFGEDTKLMEEKWYGWQVGDAYFSVGEHSKIKGKAKEPQRMIVNFETKEVREEFERIKKIGAKVIKEPYQMEDTWIATFADPDGNYFQLMGPWEK